jgi:hypothetical protein
MAEGIAGHNLHDGFTFAEVESIGWWIERRPILESDRHIGIHGFQRDVVPWAHVSKPGRYGAGS